MTTSPRHSWGARVPFPLARKTERECLNGCGVVKVTRHGIKTRTEFWRELDKIEGKGTPACVEVSVDVGRAA
jgi:hypothetical protein